MRNRSAVTAITAHASTTATTLTRIATPPLAPPLFQAFLHRAAADGDFVPWLCRAMARCGEPDEIASIPWGDGFRLSCGFPDFGSSPVALKDQSRPMCIPSMATAL